MQHGRSTVQFSTNLLVRPLNNQPMNGLVSFSLLESLFATWEKTIPGTVAKRHLYRFLILQPVDFKEC